MTASQRHPHALEWRPMRPFAGRRPAAIADPILEPLWSGLRVLAHLPATRSGPAEATPGVRLIGEGGVDLAPELSGLAADVRRSVAGTEAVIDGIITRQVGLEGVGAAAIPEVRASHSRVLLGGRAELDIRPRGRASRGPERASDEAATTFPEGFVAVDLLRLDGILLLDVPLLERKRLLESVVSQSDLVRLSVHTRPPFEAWVATWKALGLRGGILKAANSRYRPGERSLEWRSVEALGRASH